MRAHHSLSVGRVQLVVLGFAVSLAGLHQGIGLLDVKSGADSKCLNQRVHLHEVVNFGGIAFQRNKAVNVIQIIKVAIQLLLADLLQLLEQVARALLVHHHRDTLKCDGSR
jgi:hypothetical protein